MMGQNHKSVQNGQNYAFDQAPCGPHPAVREPRESLPDLPMSAPVVDEGGAADRLETTGSEVVSRHSLHSFLNHRLRPELPR